jgi:predicted permease
MDRIRQDLRFAFASLRRSPGFAITVVLVMALGIGVNSMMFTVVRGVLMQALPFPQPDEIVQLVASNPSRGWTDGSMSAPDIRDVAERSRTLQGVTAYLESQAYLTLGGDPQRFRSTLAGDGLPGALGVQPALGRWFRPEECRTGNTFGAVVLGWRIWQEHFGGDRDVLGRTVRLNGRVREIVGVMPQGFRFPETSDFFTPMAVDDSTDTRGGRYISGVARLAPGARPRQAAAELAKISADLARQYPGTNEGVTLEPVVLRDHLNRQMRPMMLLLSLAVGFVLLIACANVANMLLARSTVRQREVGVRLALGATRGRLVQQMLTESLLLSLAGGLLGILLGQWGLELTLASIPEEFPYWMHFELDRGVLVYSLALSVLTGVAFGLAPALHATGGDTSHALREGSAGSGESPSRRRLRNGLVVAEVVLAVVLLVGSGLMVRSFLHMAGQASAVRGEGVLTGAVTLPYAVFPGAEQKAQFFRELRGSLAALPGVESVGAALNMHLGNSQWTMVVQREGVDGPEMQKWPQLAFNVITPGYLGTMGIPLRRGRDFTDADSEKAPRVCVVNASAARQLWPGQDPIGRRWRYSEADSSSWVTVVGVIPDLRQRAAADAQFVPEVLVPHAQRSEQTLVWAIRTQAGPGPTAAAVRRLLRERSPDVPFYSVRSFGEHMRNATWPLRVYSQLLGVFSVLAMLIAALGIHGVMAYAVAQRTREIGIRMALGAARADVHRLVVGQAMRLTLAGIGLGVAAAYGLTRFMANQLFGVRPDDPPTFLGVALILAASGLVAAWIPASRATRVNPVVALRAD